MMLDTVRPRVRLRKWVCRRGQGGRRRMERGRRRSVLRYLGPPPLLLMTESLGMPAKARVWGSISHFLNLFVHALFFDRNAINN